MHQFVLSLRNLEEPERLGVPWFANWQTAADEDAAIALAAAEFGVDEQLLRDRLVAIHLDDPVDDTPDVEE